MRSKILVSILAITTIVQSVYIFKHDEQPNGQAMQEMQRYFEWDHPNKPFDASRGRDTSNIKWERADNVVESCEKESKRRGFNGFGGAKMLACSFYIQDQCTIITSKNATMHTLGHEVRHCFQGAWH